MANIYRQYSRGVSSLEKAGQKQALKVFQAVAAEVPAYADFLKKSGVNPKKVRGFADFQKLPLITKDNYLRQYPMNKLMWRGNEFNGDLISVSSGSTGEPYFWLRNQSQQEEAAEFFVDMYKNSFDCDKIPTLLVVCFSMGIWIAGSYTTLGGISANRKGLKLNIITPALDVSDALAVIKRLHKNYQQLILAGYPPFLKDLVDKGAEEGLNWTKLKIGYTPAGEVIGEELRNYFLKHGTAYKDPTKITSIYGTVDAGIVAYETPLSIILRRQIYKRNLQENYFGRQVLPTLAQYDPRRRFIESIDGSIVFTASTGIPLVRYNIKDLGGTVTKLEDIVADDYEFQKSITKHGLDIRNWARPFVYVHGRSDFTASLYAVLIYPENIKKALFKDEVSRLVTGRFVMSVKYKKNLNQYLEILVELRKDVKADKQILQHVQHSIAETLEHDNFEYRKLKKSIGHKAVPLVKLKPHDDPQHFPRTVNKQRWTAEALKAR
ncbi:MAG: phenylacetate--CoA ligase family protein [Candidatus Saccharimonadales bacterium]